MLMVHRIYKTRLLLKWIFIIKQYNKVLDYLQTLPFCGFVVLLIRTRLGSTRHCDSMEDDSEKQAIQSVLEGNKDEFRVIIEKYQRRIKAYIGTFVGYHQEDIDDISSNTFIKVYVNLASYNPRLKFSSWVYRIAHNEAINYIKKNKKHLSVDIDKQDWRVSYEIDFDKPRRDDIERVLQRLNESDRNLLILFYLEELSIREISEILKCSENSAKSRLSQARKKAQKISKPT